MASEEQLAILRQGIEAWNNWRKTNSQVHIDLSGADLRGWELGAKIPSLEDVLRVRDPVRGINLQGADLRGADLLRTDLAWGNFAGANLSEANLAESDLSVTNFSDANLSGANLNSANLKVAVMDRAILANALMHGTRISDTSLIGTRFHAAQLGNAALLGLNLREPVGLDEILHLGPSSIDNRTLIMSAGQISEVFLRGIGWADYEIEQVIPVYKQTAVEFYSGFISYSSKDEEFARRLYNDLQAAGVRVWFAPEDLKIGEEFGKVINREIRLRDKLILVLSENSVNSEWVAYEVEKALEEEERRNEGKPKSEPMESPVLFPIAIDDAFTESDEPWTRMIKRRRHIGDFRGWKEHDKYKRTFDRLLRDLMG